MEGVMVFEVVELIINIYVLVGWGKIIIKYLNFESKILFVELKDSWEYKINVV